MLETISRTLEQLMAYNARLKFQRDEIVRIQYARQEGVEIGETRGRQIGRISLLQELPGQCIWSAEEFAARDSAQLNSMADQLQRQLRARNS